MKKFVFGIFTVYLLLTSCGCALLLIGGGVAGGIAISQDTAKLEIDRSFDRGWSVTYSTLKNMGTINLEDRKTGKIEADIKGSQVIAHISQITARSIRVEIKARKNLFPNVDLATEILNLINRKI
jgi:hypothetical protein